MRTGESMFVLGLGEHGELAMFSPAINRRFDTGVRGSFSPPLSPLLSPIRASIGSTALRFLAVVVARCSCDGALAAPLLALSSLVCGLGREWSTGCLLCLRGFFFAFIRLSGCKSTRVVDDAWRRNSHFLVMFSLFWSSLVKCSTNPTVAGCVSISWLVLGIFRMFTGMLDVGVSS